LNGVQIQKFLTSNYLVVRDEIHVPVTLARKRIRPSLPDMGMSETRATMDKVAKFEP